MECIAITTVNTVRKWSHNHENHIYILSLWDHQFLVTSRIPWQVPSGNINHEVNTRPWSVSRITPPVNEYPLLSFLYDVPLNTESLNIRCVPEVVAALNFHALLLDVGGGSMGTFARAGFIFSIIASIGIACAWKLMSAPDTGNATNVRFHDQKWIL